MNPDLYWLPGPWRGKLAIAARPRGGDWLGDEASGWRASGLDVVVSLLEKEEAAQLDLLDERQAVEANNLRFLSFPIPDRGVPPSISQAVALLRELAGSTRGRQECCSPLPSGDRPLRANRGWGLSERWDRYRQCNRSGEFRPRTNSAGDYRAASMASTFALRASGGGALSGSFRGAA